MSLCLLIGLFSNSKNLACNLICSASFISTTKAWHALAFQMKVFKICSFLFFFSCVWDIIIQSIAVALDEFVLDAIYPCGGCHAGHSRVCASLIDQEVAVLFDIPLLLELCVEKPTQRAKPSITYLYHQWRNLRYWFDRLWFCLGIVLWLTKLNHKYFRDQWASNFARRLSFIEWRIPFWERQECCQWLCVVYGNVSRCQSK